MGIKLGEVKNYFYYINIIKKKLLTGVRLLLYILNIYIHGYTHIKFEMFAYFKCERF